MFEPEAAPGFGDQDAVAGVADVVANLDGLVDAIAANKIGELRNVLGAVVGHSGETVAVEKDVRGRRDAVFAVEGAGVDEMAIGDAADEGEMFAATALQFLSSGALRADEPVNCRRRDNDTSRDAADKAGILLHLGFKLMR